ncbi:MAG: hypothetical protein Q4C88_04325 [Akkermansia sp.]|nr:hypothetical protein [Akkermansia sp.]
MDITFDNAFSASQRQIGCVFIEDAYCYQVEAMPAIFADDPAYADVVQGNLFVSFYRDEQKDPHNRAGVIITPAQLEELERKWKNGPGLTPLSGSTTGIVIDTPMD